MNIVFYVISAIGIFLVFVMFSKGFYAFGAAIEKAYNYFKKNITRDE